MAGFYNALEQNDGFGSAREQSAQNLQNWWSSGKGVVNKMLGWFNIGRS